MAEVSKAYEPQAVEAKWGQFWLDRGIFTANAESKKPAYSIVIPPPNVTGVLTLGHVLNNTIQDILARKARMEGKEVLWLPGTDHAGIATQAVVEKALKKQGVIRHRDDLGREKFLEKVWEWKEKHGGIIIQQLKKLGASCDWSRERFTMDPEFSRSARKVFVHLFQKGLIYRGRRMVNWCPASLTALSDEEVEMKEQKGFMYYFKVEVTEAPGTFLTIATTRPETIPADTGVAVNPKDPRYAHLIGKHVIRSLPPELPREQRIIPIVGDDSVDFEFGTGVLKVTPAHDKIDFEIGRRHHLPLIEAINADGTMSEAAGGRLRGMDRFKARVAAAEQLKELGLLEKEEPHVNNVGFSDRGGVPIEPRLSDQWFLKYPSVDKARACVADGAMRFFPDRWAKVYDHWMGSIQDWCISRQVWWGERVPVWRKEYTQSNESAVCADIAKFLGAKGNSSDVAVSIDGRLLNCETTGLLEAGAWKHETAADAAPIVAQICTCDPEVIIRLEAEGWAPDPDVLDTWFSSWLWPFATMGWPNSTPALAKFYPTTDLVTGPDIIFFWVARMIMAGYEFMGEMPFRNVYFTGIIRDKQGRKMSKSLGNSPDPLDLIARFGADALRFGVMRSAPLGQDILFDEQNVELGRNFCNKLWNACRFRQMQGGEPHGEINPVLLTNDDKWILLRLDAAIREVTDGLAEYRFSDVTQTLYRFFWTEFCDWYVEACKAAFHGGDEAVKTNTLAVVDFVLSHTLRLLHPYLPFITEELWHSLGCQEDMPADQGGETIMRAPWPKPFDDDFLKHYGLDQSALDLAEAKRELVAQGRNLRRERNVPSNQKTRFILKPSREISAHDIAVLKILLNAEPFEVVGSYEAKKGMSVVHAALGDLYLPFEGDTGAEKTRLTKELERINAEIAKVEAKLGNPAFVEKVPPAVLQEHQDRLADWQKKKEQILASLRALE